MRLLLADAKDLAEIQEARHYEIRLASGIPAYGERCLSLSGREASDTAAIGRALRLLPGLEAAVMDGRTTPEAAAILALLGRRPDSIGSEAEWLERAQHLSAKELRKVVRQHLRDAGELARRRPVSCDLSEQGAKDLDRAMVLAAPSSETPVGIREAVETALRFYVKRKDPLERTPGKRRMPPTDAPDAPRSRTVPADVNRTVFERAKRKCRLPFCDNDRFLERVHVFQRHCDGGCREAKNLDAHCPFDHGLQERGLIRNVGTTDDPVFVDERGRSLHERDLVLEANDVSEVARVAMAS